MNIKVRDLILLAKALEREASHMNQSQRDEMYENIVQVALKEEDVAEGRLVSTIEAVFAYTILHNTTSKVKPKAQENILTRVEIYDISENKRPVVTRVEQEVPQPAVSKIEEDDIQF